MWASNLTYAFSTTFIKISILAQYLRLFEGRSVLARKATWGILTIVSLWGITFGLLALFSCTPIAKNWDFTLEGKCVGWGSKDANEFFATWMSHASSNMVLDAFILMLPVPFISNLRMSGKTRTGLMTLFVLGGMYVSLFTPIYKMLTHTPARSPSPSLASSRSPSSASAQSLSSTPPGTPPPSTSSPSWNSTWPS